MRWVGAVLYGQSPARQWVLACSSRLKPLACLGVCVATLCLSPESSTPHSLPVSRVRAIRVSSSPPTSFRKYGQLKIRRF